MKKILFTLALIGLMLINTSCENYDAMKIPEKYHKVLVLQVFGEQDITLYRTGEDTNHQLSIMKAGSEDGLEAEALLEIDEEWLKQYNEENATQFVALPSEYYELENNTVKFAGSDKYKLVNLSMKTTKIEQLMKANPQVKYVLPIQMKSNDTTLSKERQYVIYKLKVVIPTIVFQNPGTSYKYCGKQGGSYPVKLTMPIENKWDFDCVVGVDESAVPEGKLLLPESMYTLSNGGLVHFTKGTNTAELTINIPNGLKTVDEAYVLPLKIKEIKEMEFGMGTDLAKIDVSTKVSLAVDMLSSNAQEPSEGSLANLLDGSLNSYFHSAWSVAVAADHYLQVNSPLPLSEFKFSYNNRFENGNAAMATFRVEAKGDDGNYTLVKKFTKTDDDLPVTGQAKYTSSVLKLDKPVNSIRFICEKNNKGAKFFVWSEFSLYGF